MNELDTGAKKTMEKTMEKNYMTSDEACEELGISKATFYAVKKKLKICGYGVGQRAKYRIEDIEKMAMMERPLKATGRRKKVEAKEVIVM